MKTDEASGFIEAHTVCARRVSTLLQDGSGLHAAFTHPWVVGTESLFQSRWIAYGLPLTKALRGTRYRAKC